MTKLTASADRFSWLQQQMLRAKALVDSHVDVSEGAWSAFDLADAMELGLSKELTSQYAVPPPGQRTRELEVTRTEQGDHVLLCEDQQPLLVARSVLCEPTACNPKQAKAFDIFMPCDGEIAGNIRPAFRLNNIVDKNTWELISLRCEQHKYTFQPPTAINSCSRCSCGQQMLLRVTHQSKPLGKARLMSVQVELPKQGDVWCNCDAVARGLKCDIETRDGILLPSRMPKWNANTKSLTLKFTKRCSKASIRNFQLAVSESLPDDIALQFGEMMTGDYALDFKEPLGPVQAFALALTTAHWK